MMSVINWLAAGAEGAAHGASARPHSEAQLDLPNFKEVHFGPFNGWTLLALGLGVSAIGMLFGMLKYRKLRNLPVHSAMREISERQDIMYATRRRRRRRSCARYRRHISGSADRATIRLGGAGAAGRSRRLP